MISQPKLGNLLTDIRKQKGWTQEELVSQCNVSVRTIQRIESGEVTPRHSTVKILLAALDYDMDEYMRISQQEAKSHVQSSNPFSKMFALSIPKNQYQTVFNAAWIAGIIYTVFAVAEIVMEVYLDGDYNYENMLTLSAIKVVAAVSIVIFYRGFTLLSRLFENTLVKAGALLYTITAVGMYGSDLLLFALGIYDGTPVEIQSFLFLILLGASGIVFGIGMLRLQDGMGKLAKQVGVIELVIAACFLSMIFSFFGLVLFVPAMILEIILLIKAEELAKEGKF